MADMNTTTQHPDTAPRKADDRNMDYRQTGLINSAMHAIELAKTISDEVDRLYCLAIAIRTKLTPEEDKDAVDVMALRLVELLEDNLSDNCDVLSLIGYLTELKDQLSSPTHAPVAGHA